MNEGERVRARARFYRSVVYFGRPKYTPAEAMCMAVRNEKAGWKRFNYFIFPGKKKTQLKDETP